MVCHAQGISPADDGDKQMSTILPTENQDWGFWGTMREHAQQAWPIAFTAIHNATSTDPASARAFRRRRMTADSGSRKPAYHRLSYLGALFPRWLVILGTNHARLGGRAAPGGTLPVGW